MSSAALLATESPVFTFSISAIGDLEITPTDPTASLSLNNDGTITYVGNGSSGSARYAPNGVSRWARLTVNSGTNPTGGGVGSVISLAAGITWTWTRTTLGTTSASCLLEIFADSGGALKVGEASFNVSVVEAA